MSSVFTHCLVNCDEADRDASEEEEMTENDADRAGTPRWVKIFGLVAAILVVIVVVLLVTGRGGGHGPGRHSDGDPTRGHTGPPPGITHQQP
jgi:hypothetical protein